MPLRPTACSPYCSSTGSLQSKLDTGSPSVPAAHSIVRPEPLRAIGSSNQTVDLELDQHGVERLPFRQKGWEYWQWRGHKVHYVQAGDSGPPVVLVHGFGASAYHWRYNIPVLARKHRVYAVDLLGFGWSDKPLEDYSSYQIWAQQLADFLREVVGGERAVLVGNSLGGFNSLATASQFPDLVRGVVLLNGAGRFEDMKASEVQAVSSALTPAEKSFFTRVREFFTLGATRMAIYGSFFVAKQPGRIRSVLNQVYKNQQNVDDQLVRSIVQPAQHPNAPEVFYRIITGRGDSFNILCKTVKAPLLLLWGAQDPWIGPSAADKIQRLYPDRTTKVLIDAGHCPHDEAPGPVNWELMRWLDGLPA